MEETKDQPKVSHDCPKGVNPGHMFVDPETGRTLCCEFCPDRGKSDNTCEFC